MQLVCDPESDIFAAAERWGVVAIPVPMKRKSLASVLAMRRIFGDFRPDIVNCHSSIDHWTSALARIQLRPRPAIVRTRHISAPVSRRPTTRWLFGSGCDFVMTTSEAIVSELVADGFLAPSKVAAVPTGIDIGKFATGDRRAARARLGMAEDRFVFTIVATLRSWKGHADLIEALSALPEAAMVVIVGDGPQEDNLKSQVAARKLENRVVLVGRQPDVVPYLHAADAFVLPSYANEGVPQAMLQAMACELPIVSCPVGGIPELTAGLAGVRLARPRDPQDLSRAMLAVMSDPPAADTRSALRQRIADLYSLDRMYQKVVAAFESALPAR